MKRKICLILLVLIVFIIAGCFISCSNNNIGNEMDENQSFKDLMDSAMQNASSATVLATVNGVNITQVHKDMYSISGKDYSTEEIVKIFVIADFAERQGLSIRSAAEERINRLRHELENDEELTEEYCMESYGISKEQVIEYMIDRSYYIWLNGAFTDMVIDQAVSGEITNLYPQLAEAYAEYEKSVSSDPSKALDDLENAYYEMIVQDYDIVFY